MGLVLLIVGVFGAWLTGNLISTGYWTPHALPASMTQPPYDRSIGIVVTPFLLLATLGLLTDVKTALDTGDGPETPARRRSPPSRSRWRMWPSRIDPQDRPALAGIALAQRAGEMIGIMGASGAGKSTLVKCLNAIIPGFEDGDFQGAVRVNGRGIDGSRVCDMAPIVGMVFQDFEAQLFSTNVAHEVAFAMEQVGMAPEQIRGAPGSGARRGGLAGFEDRDPTSLSGGEKQRLAIASVLAVQASIIVLDEPTTDLDPEGRGEVFELVRRLRDQGLSLLVIEHETEELLECDRIVASARGAGDSPTDHRIRSCVTSVECCANAGFVRPRLNHVLAELGIRSHARNIDDAEALIRRSIPAAV